MSKPSIDYTLYLVTDSQLMTTPTLEQAVEQACKGGVTLVQLREKHLNTPDFTQLALKIKQVTDRFDVPLIINDNIEVALKVNAVGVHVGQDDMNAREVRAVIGEDKIIGVSVSNTDEAIQAQLDGADYLGIGAMSFTSTKPDAKVVGLEQLPRILEAVNIPSVVIGGINAQTIPHFAGMNLAGYSVVSAIIAQPDICAAAKHLRKVIAQNG